MSSKMIYAHFPPFDTVYREYKEKPKMVAEDIPNEYVVGFLFHKNKVVLIEKTKPDWQRGKLNGVGGKIKQGEAPVEAMRREFREETGAGVYGWRHFCTIKLSNGGHVYFFSAEGKRHIETTTEEPVQWVGINQLKKLNRLPNLDWLIPLAREANDEVVVVQNI